ncbi:YebW family protein [Klebsiella variicola subsp. variicola]|nr:YebW family protein [Klebsiella variicola subsp. variicola]
MNTLFALVISVCALTGECSDVLIGVYPSEASCNSNADEQKVQGQCLPYRNAQKMADDQQPASEFLNRVFDQWPLRPEK